MVLGTNGPGVLMPTVGLVKNQTSSRLTGVLSGAPSSFQLGKSSFRARGSKTAPERMWAPTSEPFSTRQTEMSLPASAAFCLMRQAAARPAGPPPTTRTSYSITSRSTLIFSALGPARSSALAVSDGWNWLFYRLGRRWRLAGGHYLVKKSAKAFETGTG